MDGIIRIEPVNALVPTGARDTPRLSRFNINATMRRAWQALAPYCHAPVICCRASPLLLQLAVAATTVARQVSVVYGEGILL
eukprot:6197561-Pleurochrysis_carterae.AAC.1